MNFQSISHPLFFLYFFFGSYSDLQAAVAAILQFLENFVGCSVHLLCNPVLRLVVQRGVLFTQITINHILNNRASLIINDHSLHSSPRSTPPNLYGKVVGAKGHVVSPTQRWQFLAHVHFKMGKEIDVLSGCKRDQHTNRPMNGGVQQYTGTAGNQRHSLQRGNDFADVYLRDAIAFVWCSI